MLSGTVHAYVPVSAADDTATSEAVAKLSVEYSSLTVANVPALVQVMLFEAPTAQTSPPLGAVTVREPLIAKLPSEVSLTVASLASVTRTLTDADVESGIGQA